MLLLLGIHNFCVFHTLDKMVSEEHIFCFCVCLYIGPTQNKLRQARVETISTDVCNKKDVYDGLITSGMLCAGFMEGKVDACKVSPSQGPNIKKVSIRYFHVWHIFHLGGKK